MELVKKKAKKEEIGLFAGVEFSLKEGIHILLVFDDKWYQGETVLQTLETVEIKADQETAVVQHLVIA